MIKWHPEIPELNTHMQRACDRQKAREDRKNKVEEYEKTIKYWEDMSSKDPLNHVLSKQLLNARKDLGHFVIEAAREEKQYHLAVPIWERLVDSYPADITLRQKLLELYQESSDYENVIRLLRMFIDEEPSNWRHKVKLAYAFEEHGEKQLAVRTLKEVVDSGVSNDWQISYSLYLMYRRCRDFEGLIQWRKEQLSQTPDDEQLQFHLAAAYYDNRNYDEAIAVLRQLMVYPYADKHRARHEIALAYRGKQDHEAEIDTLRALVKDDPRSPTYRRDLAKAYQNAGDFSSAVEFLKGFVNSFCCDCMYLTEAFELAGEDGAIKGWKEMMNLHPDWPHLREHLVEAYQKKGDHDTPSQLLESLVDQQPENSALRRELAKVYAKAEQPEHALKGWVELVNKHPKVRGLHEQLSECFDKIGDHSAAIDEWKALTEKWPDVEDFRTRLAIAYDRKEDYRSAALVRMELLSRNPKSYNDRHQLHLALEKANDASTTIECWKTLVKRHTRNKLIAPYYTESDDFEDSLQEAFITSAEYDSAIQFWKAMMKQYPSPYNYLDKRLAEIYGAKGNIDEAIATWIEMLETSLATNQGTPGRFLFRLKEAHTKRGDKAAAITDCTNLIEIYPNNRDLIDYLSELFQETGDIDRSIDGWIRILDVNPHSDAVKARLESAYRKKGDHEVAIAGWKALRKNHPEHFSSELSRASEYPRVLAIEQSLKQAKEYERKGNFKESSRLWLDLVRQQPTRRDWESELSRNFDKLGDIDYTIRGWTQILNEFEPRALETVISQLSLAYKRKGDVDAEIQGWIDLIPRSPNQFIPKVCVAYRKKGDLDAEIDGWTVLIAKYPGFQYSMLTSQLRSAIARRNQMTK